MDSTTTVDIATENIQNAILSKPDKFFIWTLNKRYYKTFTLKKNALLSRSQTLYVRS